MEFDHGGVCHGCSDVGPSGHATSHVFDSTVDYRNRADRAVHFVGDFRTQILEELHSVTREIRCVSVWSVEEYPRERDID